MNIASSRPDVALPAANRFIEALESRLRRDFAAEPLEDCISHAAEKTIADALRNEHRAAALKFLHDISLDADRPEFAASVFCCLARQEEPVGDAGWRTAFVRSGLASDSLAIRDAAAQAAEEWGDPEMRSVLGKHSEPVDWLAGYIHEVAASLKP